MELLAAAVYLLSIICIPFVLWIAAMGSCRLQAATGRNVAWLRPVLFVAANLMLASIVALIFLHLFDVRLPQSLATGGEAALGPLVFDSLPYQIGLVILLLIARGISLKYAARKSGG